MICSEWRGKEGHKSNLGETQSFLRKAPRLIRCENEKFIIETICNEFIGYFNEVEINEVSFQGVKRSKKE